VGWFIDNTMISHTKPSVVDSIITVLEQKFGNMGDGRHLCHFLGMNVTFNNDGTASIIMPTYIQEAIDG
jgi:hypothetical protein